jgi:DHA2 family multidrug resistance protein
MLTIPATIGLFAGNRFQDYIGRRVPIYAVMCIGLVLLAVALWYNGVFADRADFGTVTWLRIVQGIAFGIFVVPTGVYAFKTIGSDVIDAASGLFALIRQVSGMIGIALLATLLQDSQNRYFRRLLLDVPRWPVLLHRAAPSRTATLAAMNQHALVIGYQHVYAMSALIVLAVAVSIALYGVAQSSPARFFDKRAADAL